MASSDTTPILGENRSSSAASNPNDTPLYHDKSQSPTNVSITCRMVESQWEIVNVRNVQCNSESHKTSQK